MAAPKNYSHFVSQYRASVKGILRQLYSAIIMLVVVEAIYQVLSFCIRFVPGASGTLWASTRKQIDAKG